MNFSKKNEGKDSYFLDMVKKTSLVFKIYST